MRVLVLGDIHGNLEALLAVLEDAREEGGFESIWCLGDTVGYGPNPSECLALLRQHPHVGVAGNHDWAAARKVGVEWFNPIAAQAALWTADRLSAEEVDYLSDLPLRHQEGPFTLAHGSPRDPLWEYVLSPEAGTANFLHFESRYCLVGHSHVPFICRQTVDGCQFQRLPEGTPVELGEDRLIINPGSVGQPRDSDPRSSYLLLDTDSLMIDHHRVPYDITAVQEKMRQADLPELLARRLAYGQ